MTRICPTCSHPIPARTRSRFCPRCSLRGALELAEDEAIPPSDSGRIIGDYELLELLGRGGMGAVYRARQLSLDRLVAVKVLLAGEFADDAARRRFQAEASSAARLRHPNIVAVYEVGEHEGRPFFSMELVEGRTFADLTRDGPAPPMIAARLLKPVAEAVHFAHTQGVLHRDLKPSNLLMDSFSLPRVTDFGLARRMDASERLTLTGEVLGSPSYLAPEQARGAREEEGVASDVYSLGAILFHLLTGRPPFLGESPQAILREVVDNEPLAPRQLNPSIPIDIETICLKCLEKEPDRRYASAQELAEELDRFLTHEPLRARPVGWAGSMWRWSLRHPARASSILALAITLLTLAIVPTVAYARIRRAEQARAIQFRETLLTQARALRLGGNSGRQMESWPALAQASNLLEKDPDFAFRLRNEAIANLALDDAWFEADSKLPGGDGTMLRFDPQLQIYASGVFRGPLQILAATNHHLLSQVVFGTNQTLQHVVDLSPDRRFVALRHGNRIAIRDLATQREVISEISGLNQFVFQSDGRGVIFLRSDSLVALSSVTGEELWKRRLESAQGPRTLALDPSDRWLALAPGNHRLELHDLKSTNVGQISITAEISALRWSSDGRLLGVGGEDGSVRIVDMSASKSAGASAAFPVSWIFETHGTHIQALAFSPDSRWLGAAANDETIRLIDARAGRMGMAFGARAFRLDFSPDGQKVGPVWKSGSAGWLMQTNSPVFRATRFASRYSNPTLAIDPAGKYCVGAGAREILVFKTDFIEAPRLLPFESGRAAFFQLNGGLLTLAHRGTSFFPQIADRVSGEGLQQALPIGIGGEVLSFSRDGKTIAVASYAEDAAVVLKHGKVIHRFEHPRIVCVAMHPDGKQLVSTSLDGGETILWNLQNGQRITSWPDDRGNRAMFSPDGRWLAQCGLRCVVRETENWKARPLLPNSPPNAEPTDAAFSPDGKWLAVIMADDEIHLLSVPEFAPLAVLDAPEDARLHRIAWSGDAGKLAALAAQAELQIWDIKALRERLELLRANWPDHSQ